MSGWTLDVECTPLARSRAALIAVGVFRDERPLRGGAGLADWRLCGGLSRLLVERSFAGELGERALLPSEARLASPRLLLLGLGERGDDDADRYRQRVCEAARQAVGLGAPTLRLHLPGPGLDDGGADALVRGLHDAREQVRGTLQVFVAVDPEAETLGRVALERALAGHPTGGVSLPRTRERRAPAAARTPGGRSQPGASPGSSH